MAQIKTVLASGEMRLFLLFNQRLQSRMLDQLFLLLTNLGSAGITIGFCLALILLSSGKLQLAAWEGSLALAISHLSAQLLKKRVTRPRPFLMVLNIRTLGRLWSDYSFPSGHTTAFAAVALAITLNYPSWGVILLPVAVLVGFSRIYLGMHYPSDVVFGLILGTAGALLSNLFGEILV